MDKVFFHIDANCFFASCEEILNPDLINKAFVVANQGTYAIISCPNKVARTYGIKAAMSVFEARKRCHELIVIEPHFDWYNKKSKELFNVIKNFTNTSLEVSSIDECYIEVSFLLEKFHNNPEILANRIINEIYNQTKLSVTIGAGNSKFLAKTAGDLKPASKFAHIFKHEIKQKLWPIEIEKVYMVGKKTSEVLKKLNIHKVIDFINYPDQNKLQQLLKKHYYYFNLSFQGANQDEINENELEKSLSQSNTFNEASDNYEFIINNLKWLTQELILILKTRKLKTNHISLSFKILDNNNLTLKTKAAKLHQYTNDYFIIWNHVLKVFNNFWNNQKLKLIGVSVNNIIDEAQLNIQNKLF